MTWNVGARIVHATIGPGCVVYVGRSFRTRRVLCVWVVFDSDKGNLPPLVFGPRDRVLTREPR